MFSSRFPLHPVWCVDYLYEGGANVYEGEGSMSMSESIDRWEWFLLGNGRICVKGRGVCEEGGGVCNGKRGVCREVGEVLWGGGGQVKSIFQLNLTFIGKG